MMTLNAALQRLVLSSPQPEVLADFYRHALECRVEQIDGEWRCEGPNRSLSLRSGAPNQLLEAHFGFAERTGAQRYAAALAARGVAHHTSPSGTVVVRDPEGRVLKFSVRETAAREDPLDPHPARLQHYGVRSPQPQTLVDFYVEALGFTVSDLVRDEAGALTAAFLRTDDEHHALAIFRASEVRFDHCSCETRDWNALREWADALSRRSVKLVWGIGRHGPGNDTFFMVHDPDGNLAEISSDLERCGEDRPIVWWPHSMQTLNLWGVAIMRS